MSTGESYDRHRATTSPLSGGYYHGQAMPAVSFIAERESDAYILERASLSSVLIARTIDTIVQEDDTELGYRFKSKVPSKVKTVGQLQLWVEDESHTSLDELVETDDQLNTIARRYEQLIVPMVTSRQRTRRDGIMFGQGITEPQAWLRVGSIAANYHGFRIGRGQALAYTIDKLGEMQVSARRDMAKQDLRGAVLIAADALGTMLTSKDRDAARRYGVLRAFVQAYTGHVITAETFGDLYDVKPDSELGIVMREQPEVFDSIGPNRQIPVACPASYRFADNPEDLAKQPSALFRLLRAGINALDQKDLFGYALVSRQTAIPAAVASLNAELTSANKNTTLELAV